MLGDRHGSTSAAPCLRLLLRLGAGQGSRLSRVCRVADEREIRLRGVVGVEEAGLPAVEIGLVADVEEEQAGNGPLAVREGDRLPVVAALLRL